MNETRQPKEEIQSPLKKWTVLIYQAGDNNLNEECIYALKEMKKIGTWGPGKATDEGPSLLNVIVQFDPAGRANPTRRFKIRGRGGDGDVERDEIRAQRRGEIDTGDIQNLLDFLCQSIEENQTDYYMVVLAGHGAGVTEGFFLKDEERPLSSIPSAFPIPLLKTVFRSHRLKRVLRGRKINILGFDACLMSMVELCYELRGIDTLELALSSEGFTLNSGWPVDRIMETIKECPGIRPRTLAKSVIADYVNYYHDYFLGGVSVDQSVIDLSRIEHLKREIDDLALCLIREFKREAPKKIIKPNDKRPLQDEEEEVELGEEDLEAMLDDSEAQELRDEKTDSPGVTRRPVFYYSEYGRRFQDAILLAHWAAQSYNGEQCVDLYDFCDLLQKRFRDNSDDESSVWFACQRVKDALVSHYDPAVVRSCFSGASFQYSFGASLYFPWGDFDFAPSYRELDFAKHSPWPRFLRLYLKATKRRPRGLPGKFREDFLHDNFRFTPPTDRGPTGKVFSMRNPPTTFLRSQCEKPDCKKEAVKDTLEKGETVS